MATGQRAEPQTAKPMDPVCGLRVDPEHPVAASVYDGRTYYFHSAACKAEFDAHPDQFVPPVDGPAGGAIVETLHRPRGHVPVLLAGTLLGGTLLGGTLLAGLLVAPCPAGAQGDTTTQAANVWLIYNGMHRVSSRFALSAEGQLRRTNGASAPKQLLLRPGLRYAWREGATVTAGYAYLRTSPYNVFSEPIAASEHRAWEQLAVEAQAGRVALEHRLRVEQRWQAELASGGRAYTNRVRYRFAATRPLHAGDADAPGWYLTATEEPFVRFGAHARGRALDQNRASLGIGHQWQGSVSVEGNYLNQYDLQPSGRGRAISHVLYLVVGVETGRTHPGAR